MSYVEVGSGVFGRFASKPGVKKGGQTVLVINMHCIRSHAYMDQNKVYQEHPGLTVMGNIEVDTLMEIFYPMVKGGAGEQKVLNKFTQIKLHDYFSGENIMDWIA